MAQPKPGAVPRRPHHISSIAHLFLQDDIADDRAPDVVPRRKCMVASPGVAPISAFASAGIALGSPGPVTLTEDRRLRWSASSFLALMEGREKSVSRTDDFHSSIWKVGGSSSAGPSDGGGTMTADAGCGELEVMHLGCLGQADLAHLESLAASKSLVGLPPFGTMELVWCLMAGEAGLLASGYTLGRVVQLLRPGRIRALIFPDAWSGAGRPGWIEEIVKDDPELHRVEKLARTSEIAGSVCEGMPLEIRCVAGPDNSTRSFMGAGAHEMFWRRQALDILKDSAVC